MDESGQNKGMQKSGTGAQALGLRFQRAKHYYQRKAAFFRVTMDSLHLFVGIMSAGFGLE
jgi:hypothetical protein